MATRYDGELCYSAPLTRAHKAYVLPQDDAPWKAYVDAWLGERVRSGAANATFNTYLSWFAEHHDPAATCAPAGEPSGARGTYSIEKTVGADRLIVQHPQ